MFPKQHAARIALLAVLSWGCSTDPSGSGTGASRLDFDTPPSPSTATGQPLPQQPVVQLVDVSGNPVAQRGVLVTVRRSDVSGGLAGTTAVRTDDAGKAAFTDLAITGPVGDRILLFTSPGLGTARSGTITVLAGEPGKILPHAGNNTTTPVDAAVTPAPAVKVLDQFDNPIAGVQVSFAATQGGGQVTGPTATTDAAGVATVGSWVMGPNAGPNQLTVSVVGFPTVTVVLNATAVSAPATVITFLSAFPQRLFVLDTVPDTVRVKVTASGGALKVNEPVTWQIQAGGGTLDVIDAVTDANAEARAVWVMGPTAGQQTLRVTAAGSAATDKSVQAHRFVTISGAGSSACSLDAFDAAWCWGSNLFTQLGDGTTAMNRTRPVAVVGGHVFEQLESAGSGNFHCGIKADGSGWCWGSARHGQLGDGTLPLGGSSSSSSPIAIAGNISWSVIRPGGDHACGLDATGHAHCWGANGFGQTGAPLTTANQTTPFAVAPGITFAGITTGSNFTCGWTSAGTVFCWGNRNGYQAGTSSGPTPVQINTTIQFASLAAGLRHTCGLTAAGAAYCWGQNFEGQLGDGSNTTRGTPTPVSGGHTFAQLNGRGATVCGLKADGSAWCWGQNTGGEAGVGHTNPVVDPTPVLGGHQFTRIGAGLFTVCGLVAPGVPWCWGPNESGQVGDGTFSERTVPTRVRP